ncbi:hypothetical protein PWT90_00696 [Aphanocladium album]|nr:hypothetical protein PWT90_00696 [Aphanocladium album]
MHFTLQADVYAQRNRMIGKPRSILSKLSADTINSGTTNIMTLCSVCDSISFADLPPFAQDEHAVCLTGTEYIHAVRRHRDFSRDPATSSVRHHANAERLREAASAGCELCVGIRDQLDLLQCEMDALDEQWKKQYRNCYQPTVDMWLVRRPGGGQGFWVLSESIQSKDEKELIPISAFNFSVPEANVEGDALANTLETRPLLESPEPHGLQQLRQWNTKCEQQHECYQPSGVNPRYLIDVGCGESDNCLEIVQPDTFVPAKYTALSYSSSGDTDGTWRPETQPNDGSISFRDLPKLFRDAISVTRTVSVQYIWIDSFCASDGFQALRRDSEEYASVYENAYLTISATGAQTVTDGLLFARPPRDTIRLPYHTSDQPGPGSVQASVLPLKKEILRRHVDLMTDEPMSKSVWSFQERVISRRIVHFASDQMYFECLNHFRAEDGLCQGERYHTTIDKLRGGPDYFREQTVMGRWYRMLCDYGRRQAVSPSEKFLGLANVARAFQRLLDDEYVAGIWRKSFIEGLCWHSQKFTPLTSTAPPSWSWACVDGSVSGGFRGNSVRLEATISEIQVNLEDEANPFGNVTSASISMEAPMIAVKLVERDHDEGWHLFVRTEEGHERGFNPGLNVMDPLYSVSAEAIRNSTLFALVLAETRRDKCLTKSCRAPITLHGLVVSPVNGSGNKVRRVGCFRTSPEIFGPVNPSESRKFVIVV